MSRIRAAASKIIGPLALLAAAAACQPLTSAETSAPTPPGRALAFVQGSCGGCHAVDRHGVSPNPDAPPFAAIVNRPGLTAETLSIWLRDAHNYPEEMEFYLEGPEVDLLVSHMLTLRDPNYRPAI